MESLIINEQKIHWIPIDRPVAICKYCGILVESNYYTTVPHCNNNAGSS